MTAAQPSARQAIDFLVPKRRELVYDILRNEIGADVSDWSNYKKGDAAPAANPKYCYEWCFTQGEHVVLNLWHASFVARGDDLVCDLNMRAYANEIARAKDDPWRDRKPKPVWEKRARSMDLAIQLAVRKQLPIRVIVCEGEMRDVAAGDERASQVKRRMLDPVPWRVEHYDLETGRTTLRRGSLPVGPTFDSVAAPALSARESAVPPEPGASVPSAGAAPHVKLAFADQFDDVGEGAPNRRDAGGSVFARSPAVRAAALRRAGGVCQLCGQRGFMTLAGQIYLETHHVKPLSAGGLDKLTNVVALCATDHRRAHFDVNNEQLRSKLLQIAAGE